MTSTLPALALLAAVALGSTGLAGCGDDPEPRTTDAGRSSDAAPLDDVADLPDQPEPAADDALPLQPLDRALLPDGFPADVAVADGDLQLADPTDAGWAVLVVTSYPAEQTGPVIAGAKDLLVEGGWTVTAEPSLGAVRWTLEKGGVELVLSGYADAAGAALNYNVGGGLS